MLIFSFKELSFLRDSYYRWKINEINKAFTDFLQTAYFCISNQAAKGEIIWWLLKHLKPYLSNLGPSPSDTISHNLGEKSSLIQKKKKRQV